MPKLNGVPDAVDPTPFSTNVAPLVLPSVAAPLQPHAHFSALVAVSVGGATSCRDLVADAFLRVGASVDVDKGSQDEDITSKQRSAVAAKIRVVQSEATCSHSFAY